MTAEHIMHQLTLAEVTEKVQELPSLPGIVMDILNQIDDDTLDIQILVEKVSSDAALTAKTLHYANSAYFSTMVKVTTVQQAISLMGLSATKQIILAAGLAGCFPENNCPGFSHKDFWRHSNAVAIAARLLAKRLQINPDVAYTAGLLHDIGALVLVTQFPEQYAATIAYRHAEGISQFDAERYMIGIDHAAVGEALAELWSFSEVMKHAIAGHHFPEKPGLGFLATVIHVANGIAHALGVTTTPDKQRIEVSAQSWESLQMSAEAIDQLMTATIDELHKLDQIEV